ncbi:Thiamin pyrophosphokinase [hydrothermal vent metagenome]|uniref:Thiamin pyrophosphokinase n=1 Tax=hydrothermal vent metagenome TaxID=652676 RepID=A0A3B0RTY6_9ZZZZ
MDNSKQKCQQETMRKFVVLLNGELTITERLKNQIAGGHVVGVDGGMRHAEKLGVQPEFWIGDFDSSSKELQEKWADVQRLVHPVEKDQTDGDLALEFVLSGGAQEIVLVGGVGGQADHTVCHITQLIRLRQQNLTCFATSGIQEVWPLVAGSLQWDFPIGATVSLVGFSALKNLSLSGVKWPLTGRNVEFGSSLTMSNEVTDKVSGSLEQGFGVVFVKDIG